MYIATDSKTFTVSLVIHLHSRVSLHGLLNVVQRGSRLSAAEVVQTVRVKNKRLQLRVRLFV